MICLKQVNELCDRGYLWKNNRKKHVFSGFAACLVEDALDTAGPGISKRLHLWVSDCHRLSHIVRSCAVHRVVEMTDVELE